MLMEGRMQRSQNERERVSVILSVSQCSEGIGTREGRKYQSQ